LGVRRSSRFTAATDDFDDPREVACVGSDANPLRQYRRILVVGTPLPLSGKALPAADSGASLAPDRSRRDDARA